jgi:hypothetical protein
MSYPALGAEKAKHDVMRGNPAKAATCPLAVQSEVEEVRRF